MKKLHPAIIAIGSFLGGLVLERIWYFYPATFPDLFVPPLQNFVLLFADTAESADDLSILILILAGTAIVAAITFFVRWMIGLKNKPLRNM